MVVVFSTICFAYLVYKCFPWFSLSVLLLCTSCIFLSLELLSLLKYHHYFTARPHNNQYNLKLYSSSFWLSLFPVDWWNSRRSEGCCRYAPKESWDGKTFRCFYCFTRFVYTPPPPHFGKNEVWFYKYFSQVSILLNYVDTCEWINDVSIWD